MDAKKPFLLMILDGWGMGKPDRSNAVFQAETPFLDQLKANYPATQLVCSGPSVGLPEGIMGNSEVGHLNIGAGRIVYQDLLRIDTAISDGSFYKNQVFLELMHRLKEHNKSLHLMGLLSDGGVHSQLTHLFALLSLSKQAGVKCVFVHPILDGRDTSPDSGVTYLESLIQYMDKIGHGRIATICGRYYAMDRDNRWDRVERAYCLYTKGQGQGCNDPIKAIRDAYKKGETDEFVQPVFIKGEDEKPMATVSDGDGIIFFNFRADRARELTRAFTHMDFTGFKRKTKPALTGYVCMTLYDETFDLPMAFAPAHLSQILGEVISQQGLRQLRIAETEKYAHVTYFFNGGEERSFPGEDRCLIDSPRDVPTYDHKPEMSAFAVTKELLKRLKSNTYDFIVVNFANMDMVGHTGVQKAAETACTAVDKCVQKIVEKTLAQKGILLITADHGNAETMRDEKGDIHTAHTTNPVPFILVSPDRLEVELNEGVLGDIAPTMLELMEIAKPDEMTGKSLLKKSSHT
jgi:2,3-bisphosphoglycerate-independent phosphoglycerate mutase